MNQKVLLTKQDIDSILHRLACQLIEKHHNFSESVIIGLQPRGVYLANRIKNILENAYQIKNIDLGFLDITFFRDDFRRNEKSIEASETQIDFLVENKNVIFIDDVIFTGRSVASALNAIQSFGRPKTIELLTLIDRKFCRHLPIQPDYSGKSIDATITDKVKVYWKENADEDQVFLITN